MGRRLFPLMLAALLAGCTAAPGPDPAARRAPPSTSLPAMKTFAPARVAPPQRANSAIARDFLDLSFAMESGQTLPALTRFDGPLTLRVIGDNPPPTLRGDLNALLGRLRREAGLDITLVGPDTPAALTIETLPQARLQRLVPQAACFVVPNVTDWDGFRRNRRAATVDWARIARRERAAIFIPNDVSPQEIRDCLHEELAQALGPLNDLYRLSDSVFNDDNFHTVLTGFDMLMLRIYYAPELQNGMTRDQVARRLPAILARLNPAGQRQGPPALPATPRAWIDAVENALGPRRATASRLAAARRAATIATTGAVSPTQQGFSALVLGRVLLGVDAQQARLVLTHAARIYASLPDTEIQQAHVALHLAAFALSSGDSAGTIALVDEHLPAARGSQNAALLATLLLMKAEALELEGRSGDARAIRLDSLGWARYGFGSEREIRQRERDVAGLTPGGTT